MEDRLLYGRQAKNQISGSYSGRQAPIPEPDRLPSRKIGSYPRRNLGSSSEAKTRLAARTEEMQPSGSDVGRKNWGVASAEAIWGPLCTCPHPPQAVLAAGRR